MSGRTRHPSRRCIHHGALPRYQAIPKAATAAAPVPKPVLDMDVVGPRLEAWKESRERSGRHQQIGRPPRANKAAPSTMATSFIDASLRALWSNSNQKLFDCGRNVPPRTGGKSSIVLVRRREPVHTRRRKIGRKCLSIQIPRQTPIMDSIVAKTGHFRFENFARREKHLRRAAFRKQHHKPAAARVVAKNGPS